ncbi:DUF6941 family protein [Longimicrobium sp.]|uniref:DUF6941 family protein n=1 Tax=Longimicrobium sp. TaxID=2029185 RepID=UPI002B56888E|nr:hypothetical protein [Longimicrobium sp.]HSU16275.1 hypothetical protein [Longimicrobium sp.]
MKILYALLCESAQERPDGRLDVHGVFHQLYAPGFPAQQERMTFAVALEWEAHERGRIEFSIELVDPARSPVLSITGHTEVAEQQPMQGPPQTRVVMPLDNVVFPAEGTYAFELVVDGERQRLTPLHLLKDTAMN